MLTAVSKRWTVALGLAAGFTLAIWYRVGSSPTTLATPAPSAAPAATAPAVKAQAATTPTVTTTPSARIAPGSIPTMDDVQAAIAEDDSNDVLILGLGAHDPVVVAEAANALVGRGALDAIPALLDADIAARPWAAPSLIYAMGKLSAVASDYDHDRLVDRLLDLLAQEKARGAQESQGNILQIYEALGDTGDGRAITALEAELADPMVKTAPKVVVVQALVTLGARDSRPLLERVAGTLTTQATSDDFEAELRRDLLAAIREALVQLS